MAGLASIGIKIKYSASEIPNTAEGIQGAAALPNCQSCPSLGGDTDQIDVTCFGDAVKKYIPGLKDFSSLEFTFLIDNQEEDSSFETMKSHEGEVIYFAVELPARSGYSFGGGFVFSAVPTVDMNEIGVGEALTWTLSMSVQSDIEYAAPAAAVN
ncbi:MAG: phage tail tube protein [bacterium]|nr:phage tail tube protein [bacterium]